MASLAEEGRSGLATAPGLTTVTESVYFRWKRKEPDYGTPSFETRVGNLKKGTAMRVLRVFVIVFGIDLSLIVIERSSILLALRDIKNYSCRCPSRDLSKICHRL